MIYALLLAQAAATAAPACTIDAALPPALVHWAHAQAGTALTVGMPVVLATTVAGTPAPAKPGKVANVSFSIAKAGTYTVALGAGGWIDVVPAAGGTPLTSTGHGHLKCSSVRKAVAFSLTPGRYTLQLTGLRTDSVKVAVVAGDQTPKS